MQLQDLLSKIRTILDHHQHPFLSDQLLNDRIDNFPHLLTLFLIVDHAGLKSDSKQIGRQSFLVDLD